MKLTHRQKQLLQLLANDYSQKQAAEKMGLSPHTVKNHLHNARQKNSARNTAHLVAMAYTEGIIK